MKVSIWRGEMFWVRVQAELTRLIGRVVAQLIRQLSCNRPCSSVEGVCNTAASMYLELCYLREKATECAWW